MQKILKGDNVEVMAGKDKGRKGAVARVVAKENMVFIEGVNISKRHVRKMGQTEGGIIDIIKPLGISKIALVCPNCKKPTRVGFKLEKDTKVRVCRKCGKEIK